MAKKRELANNLNLVPFIDLFSTLIIFLIATAVWEQLSSVPISMGSTDKNPIEMPASSASAKVVEAQLKVQLNEDRIVLSHQGRRVSLTREEAQANNYQAVGEFVTDVRSRDAAQKEVVFEVADKAVYEDLVGTMDQFLAEEFDELIVMGAR